MVVLLGLVLLGILVFARGSLWAAGMVGKTLYVAVAVFAVALTLLLVIERIEGMGEY
uniref:hypothetical protein n=1 Tax=Roseovarius sp. BRH_c41 TaxID=1629709 RepID=UPI000A5CEC43|nr:hypothetical protein [Roseovarius sp. BRH_c41]